MFGDDYLRLRQVRLNGTEKWQAPNEGFAFVFVRGGTGKLAVDSATHRVGQGDVLVISGASGGKLVANAEELALSHFNIRLEQMYPLFSIGEIPFLQNLVGNLGSMRLHPANSPLAIECHQLIGSSPAHFNLEHRTHLLRVVATVLGEELRTLQRGRTGYVSMEDHLIQVFEKLTSRDLLTLSANELAGKFGCSRRHLARMFNRHFGMSVAALRMELRMLRAISLLQDTQAKVINVAEQCGFNHLGLFNTCFRRRFGTSPGQWRTMQVKNSAGGTPSSNGGGQIECPFQTNGLCPKLGASPAVNPPTARDMELRTAALSVVFPRAVEARKVEGGTRRASLSEPALPATLTARS